MTYRSDLDAARARIESLERDLANALEKIRDLESRPSPKERSSSSRPREPGASRRLGGIHFHPPRTYLPFLVLFGRSLEAAWVKRPSLARPSSEAVWRWIFHYAIAVPVTYGLRLPLYFLALCVLLPWTFLICCALTALCLPFLVASRFSFSTERPDGESGWWHGEPTIHTAGVFLWIVLSISLAPLLLVTTSLLGESESSSRGR